MIPLLILLIIIIGYGLLWWLIPPGNVIHEGLRIPFHLWKLRSLDSVPMKVEKIRYGTHFRQYLLYCTPEEGVTKTQGIIYYHGGAWMFGRPEMFYANAGFFIRQGYAVVMPSYRRPPWHRYRSIRRDLSLAMKKAIKTSQEKEPQINGWIAAGMSAGANLAALLSLDQQALHSEKIHPNSIRGMLLMGAPLDLSAMPPSIPLHSFAGWRHSPEFRAANPVNYLPPPQPIPLLAIHGTNDGLVPYPAASNFVRHWPPSLLQMYTIPDGTHLDCSAYLLGDKKMQKLILQWLEKHQNGR